MTLEPWREGDPLSAARLTEMTSQTRVDRELGIAGIAGSSGASGTTGGQPEKLEPLYAKLDEELDGGAGETATASIYRLNEDEDDWEDTGIDKTVYAPPLLASGDSLAIDTWVDIEWRQNRWFVTNAACDAS